MSAPAAAAATGVLGRRWVINTIGAGVLAGSFATTFGPMSTLTRDALVDHMLQDRNRVQDERLLPDGTRIGLETTAEDLSGSLTGGLSALGVGIGAVGIAVLSRGKFPDPADWVALSLKRTAAGAALLGGGLGAAVGSRAVATELAGARIVRIEP